ncbi:MAG: lysylphosphatidylglycerol synthase transmembrane domain-containing protein [Candidatus Eisenbacteria bacterium]
MPSSADRPSAAAVRRRLAFSLARVAVAAAILILLARRIDLRASLEALRGAASLPVVLALLLGFLAQLLVTLRLLVLARGQALASSFGRLLEINLSAVFYGLFLPGSNLAGTAVRFARIARAERRSAATAVALLADRMIATASLGAVGVLFWTIDRAPGSGSSAAFLALGTAALLLLLLPLFRPGIVEPLARRLPARLPLLSRFREPLTAYGKLAPARIVAIAIPSLTAHLAGILAFVLLARALGMEVSALRLGWIRSLVVFSTMLPLTIAGFGVREATVVVLLGAAGVPETTALAYSFLVFAVTVLPIGFAGGWLEARSAIASWLPVAARKPPVA